MINFSNMERVNRTTNAQGGKTIDFNKMNVVKTTRGVVKHLGTTVPLITVSRTSTASTVGKLIFNKAASRRCEHYKYVTVRTSSDYSVIALEFHRHRVSEADYKLTHNSNNVATISGGSIISLIEDNSDFINTEVFLYKFKLIQNGDFTNQFYIELKTPYEKNRKPVKKGR